MSWNSRDEQRRDRRTNSRSRSSSSTDVIVGALVFLGVCICFIIVIVIYKCCKKASKKAAKVDRTYYKNGNSHKEGTMPPQPSYMPSHPPPTGIMHSQKSQRLPSTSSASRHQTHQQPYPPQLPATSSSHSNAPYPPPMSSSPMPAASYPPSASPYPPAAPLPMMPAVPGVADQQQISSPYPPLPASSKHADNAYPPSSPYPPAPPSMPGSQQKLSDRSHGAYPPSTHQSTAPPIAVMPSAPYPPTNSPVNSAGKGGGNLGWNSQALQPQAQPSILAGGVTNLGMPPPPLTPRTPSTTGSRSHAKVHLQPAVIHPAPPPSKHARSLRSNRDSNKKK